MSLYNPSDFNGDGRTDYVDYKIYTNYIDPQSGEYQGDMFQQSGRPQYRRQKSGLTFVDFIIFMALFLVLFCIILATPLSEAPELAAFVVMGIWLVCLFFYIKKKNSKRK